MEDQKENSEEKFLPVRPERPFLLTVLSLFAFVFYGFISLLFGLALFYSGWITEIVNKYLPENTQPHWKVTVFALSGFLLHAISFAGTILMWKMKRLGYILFSVSSLIITSYQLFQTRISFMTTAVYILLIVIFGLFYKRFR